jgi:hypothetical protein
LKRGKVFTLLHIILQSGRILFYKLSVEEAKGFYVLTPNPSNLEDVICINYWFKRQRVFTPNPSKWEVFYLYNSLVGDPFSFVRETIL